ncbi:MAG: PTS sugar transporter subunit IIB [Elusimicrobiales bacterium]|nr:PTS sugar transporter subunit IIB [Elusimicrobiales bacterium]
MIIFRVDDRLIHGQVVENWLSAFSINHIVVSSKAAVNDELKKNIMKFSVPDGVLLDFIDPIGLNKFIFDDKKNYLVLFESLEDVILSVDSGFRIERLNLGGIHYAKGRNFSMGRVLFLSEAERNILKKLIDVGVDVYMQSIPQETSVKLRGDI